MLAVLGNSCTRERADHGHGAPPPAVFPAKRSYALYTNGGFESGNLNGWTVESYLNNSANGVTYPTVNGTTVPPQSINDLNLGAGGVANTAAAGPSAANSAVPNGMSSSSTLRYPMWGQYAAVINGAASIAAGSSYSTGANKNVNSIRQSMVVQSADIDPNDGLPHVRFVVAPVLQNPNHVQSQQPYYFIHVTNKTTGQDLFNRFNFVNQGGSWQSDSLNGVQYLPWQVVDVWGAGQVSVGDDMQVQVLAAGCSAGAHWGEAYVDAFGSTLPGVFISAKQPQYAPAGASITTSFIIENGASTAGTNLVITIPTPANATFGSFTPPAGMTCSGIPAVGGTGTITCNVASINPLAALPFNIVWNTSSGAKLPADVTNAMYSITSTEQPTKLLGMPVTTYLTSGTTFADYSISITDGVTAAAPGTTLKYTVVVNNAGATVVSGGSLLQTTINETNPTGGLSNVSWTCTATGTATVSGSSYSSSCPASGTGLIANQIVQLVGGGSATFTVSATAGAPSSGSYVTNAVSLTNTFPSGYGDPDPTNNAASDNDAVGALVAITATKDASGAGTGRISSAPAGLDCGTGCTSQTANFASNVAITLTAVADAGNSFSGWTAGPCANPTAQQCTFTPTAGVTVTAKFLPPQYTIAASSSANGTITCASPVYSGQSSTCTLSANPGYSLTAFTDNGTAVTPLPGGTYTLANVTANHTVYATFTQDQYAVAGSATPPAGGSVSCTPATVTYGQSSTCTVTTNPGYTLTGVTATSGTVSGSGSSYTVSNITANDSVVAAFSQNHYQVTASASPQAGGTIGCSPTTVTYGQSSTCTVGASAGYTLAGVTANGAALSGSNGSYTVANITGDTPVVASFSQNHYSVTGSASPPAGGSVSCSPASVTYGQSSTCTVTTSAGYTLSGVTSNNTPITGSNGSYTISNITTNDAVVATFTQNHYAISASVNDAAAGSISCSPTSVTYGQSSTCTVTTNAGYTLAGVTANGAALTGSNGSYTVSDITANQTVTAAFTQNHYAISASASPAAGGSISCAPATVTYGQSSTCSVATNPGYTLASVTANGAALSGSNGSYTVSNVTASQTVTASFTQNQYAIAAAASPAAGGTLSCSPTTVTYGQSSACTVTTNAGYTLASVTANGAALTASNGSYTVANITANQTVTASFTQNHYAVAASVNLTAGGSVSCSPASVTYGQGSTCTVTTNPGYTLASVTANGTALTGSNGSYTVANITADEAVAITFTQDQYAIAAGATPAAGGSISCAPSTVTYGQSSTCTVTTTAGYTLAGVTANGVALSGANGSYTVANITSNQTVTASFTQNHYALSASVTPAAAGSISCSPSSVTYGQSSTCTVTGNPGYTLAGITANAAALSGSNGSYTVSNITADQTVLATFTQDHYAISASVNPAAHGSISCAPASVTYGQSSTCTVTTSGGYTIASVTANGAALTGSNGSYLIANVTADETVLATLAAPNQYVVTASAQPAAGGSISCAPGVVTSGGSSTCTVGVNAGYTLSGVTANGATVSPDASGNYVLANVAANQSVVAAFTQNQYAISGTASPAAAGTISCAPSPVTWGQNSACTIAPAAGQGLFSLTDNNLDVTAAVANGVYAVNNVTAGHVVVATFRAQFRVTASASGSGTLTCQSPVFTGASSTCTVAAASGQQLTTLTDNGADVTASVTNGSYALQNVTADHAVAASFLPVNGATCTADNQCASGACVDGYCCDSACGGECQACDVPGSEGTCSPVAGKPHGVRPACGGDGSSCGGACDGTNVLACAYPTSQCNAASCANGVASPATSCDGAGHCPAPVVTSCTPYACGVAACKTSCGSDTDCAAADYCSAGRCVPRGPQGGFCTADDQCGTGHCADGVCCDSACGGECQACDVPGHAGTCSPVVGAPHGARPACASDGSSCGGSCDGTNVAACAYPTAQCVGASCANGAATAASSCDGAGHCPAPAVTQCNPYVCGATACKTACGSDNDCVSGDYCNASGQCVPRAKLAAACTADDQCGSGHCTDGVCCDSACGSECQACDVPGHAGTCSAVTGAPHGARPACATDGSSCGGSCDGTKTDACAYPTSECGAASCANGTATAASSCDGAGHCPQQVVTKCNPYVCGATACRTSCGSDGDCVAGDFCDARGQCVPRNPLSTACTADDQCASGHCTDGVCCDSACNGQCQACDVRGSAGTCSPVAAGDAPHGARTACTTDGTACGGACDGTNPTACGYPTTACRGATCANGTATLAASCDGAGHCPAVQQQQCAPLLCDATGTACEGGCQTAADCIAGDWCSAGVCKPKLQDGQACSGNEQCGNGNCVDGLCCNSACTGQCEACNVAGSEGSCSPVAGAPQGNRGACASDGSACGGACDGTHRAACAYPSQATGCRDASCANGTATLAAACDGAGSCPSVQTQLCAPYACDAAGKACLGDCRQDADCTSGDFCNAGVCTPRLAPGGTCTSADQCGSGFCVDGVCCNAACDGQCQACDVAGSVGTCTAATGAPHGARAACATDGSQCGGSCDGVNPAACVYPITACRGATCSGDVATLAASCDGAGHCPAVQQQHCTPYACGATACLGDCEKDADCVAGDYCAAGICRPRLGTGTQCSSNAQCDSGECVDGVCCNTACNGACEACDVPGSVGTCSAAKGAPHGGRAACTTDGTSCAGACDGNVRGACTYPVAACRPAGACMDNVRDVAVSCDGAGHCPALRQEACACANDTQCSAANYCFNGACKPRGDNGLWAAAGSGGCTQAGGAVTWPLLALLAVFTLRRRRRAAAAVVLAAGAASAQGVSTSFSIDRFQPGAGSFDVLGVASPETAPNLEWHASAYADYARDPLRLYAIGAPNRVQLVRNQSMLHLGASVGLGDGFELGAVLPMALQQGSESGAFLGGPLSSPIPTGGLGDLRVLPKARLLRTSGVTLGVGLPVTLPTGRSDAFLSHGALTVTPTALLEYAGGLPLRLVANAGVILRQARQLTNLKVAQGLAYGVGGELPLTERLTALSTLQGEIDGGDGMNGKPLELLGALRWSAVPGVDLIGGAGPGLTTGYGTPKLRVFFSLAISDAVLPKQRRAPAPVLPAAPPPAALVKALPPPEPKKPEPSAELALALPIAPLVAAPAPDLDLPIAPLAPPVLAKLETAKIDLLAPVRFAVDRDVLLASSRGVLDAAVQVLKAHPELLRVRVEGHTDAHGSPAHNRDLSIRRARAVLRYLVSHGIDEHRLESAGYGADRPVDTNATDAGRARNRRVDLTILERAANG